MVVVVVVAVGVVAAAIIAAAEWVGVMVVMRVAAAVTNFPVVYGI